MRHAILKVANTHYGPLLPGMLIVIPESDVGSRDSDSLCSFKNPYPGGGWSIAKFIGYTTPEQDEAIEKEESNVG